MALFPTSLLPFLWHSHTRLTKSAAFSYPSLLFGLQFYLPCALSATLYPYSFPPPPTRVPSPPPTLRKFKRSEAHILFRASTLCPVCAATFCGPYNPQSLNVIHFRWKGWRTSCLSKTNHNNSSFTFSFVALWRCDGSRGRGYEFMPSNLSVGYRVIPSTAPMVAAKIHS